MSTKTITSAMAPVITGSGKSKLTTYIATKVTGPVKDAGGLETFLPEIGETFWEAKHINGS